MKVKNAVNFIGEFEHALAGEADRVGADGVVCGHIHHAVIGEREGIEYINTGDWVESCTAVVEEHDGRLRLIDWADITRRRLIEAGAEGHDSGSKAGKQAAKAA